MLGEARDSRAWSAQAPAAARCGLFGISLAALSLAGCTHHPVDMDVDADVDGQDQLILTALTPEPKPHSPPANVDCSPSPFDYEDPSTTLDPDLSTVSADRPALDADPSLVLCFEGHWYLIDQDQFIIGRGSKFSDLPIKDANISRRHCAIVRRNGEYFIKDLGSTNGIMHDGQRVDDHVIEDGDIFYVTNHRLRFWYRPLSKNKARTPAEARAPAEERTTVKAELAPEHAADTGEHSAPEHPASDEATPPGDGRQGSHPGARHDSRSVEISDENWRRVKALAERRDVTPDEVISGVLYSKATPDHDLDLGPSPPSKLDLVHEPSSIHTVQAHHDIWEAVDAAAARWKVSISVVIQVALDQMWAEPADP